MATVLQPKKWIMPYSQKKKQGFVKTNESYKDYFFVVNGNIFACTRSSICKDTRRMIVQVYYVWFIGHMQVFGTFLYPLTLPLRFFLCISSFRL
jgi:hypothetical protein